MRAQILYEQKPVENLPLGFSEVEIPSISEDQALIEVISCGICRTDIHIVEGDLPLHRLPLIVGHQIVGIVAEKGKNVEHVDKGDLVGIPWLHYYCGECIYCKKGLTNLCQNIEFTGYDVDGGYAEYVSAHKKAIYKLGQVDPYTFAPILCGGVIGYRAFKLTGLSSGAKLGIIGFGSSAHMVLQIAIYKGLDVYVFTRTPSHKAHALEMGARWAGSLDENCGVKLDGVIVFAPVGELMVEGLKLLDKGGTVVSAGIHMSDIPSFPYSILYEERKMLSTANSTPEDVLETIELAKKIPIKTNVSIYDLKDANRALLDVKYSKISGSAVLAVR